VHLHFLARNEEAWHARLQPEWKQRATRGSRGPSTGQFGHLQTRRWDGIHFVAGYFGSWRGAKREHSHQRSVTDEQRSQGTKAPQESVFHPTVWSVASRSLRIPVRQQYYFVKIRLSARARVDRPKLLCVREDDSRFKRVAGGPAIARGNNALHATDLCS